MSILIIIVAGTLMGLVFGGMVGAIVAGFSADPVGTYRAVLVCSIGIGIALMILWLMLA